MKTSKSIFGDYSNFENRYFMDFAKLGKLAAEWKKQGKKIVLTSGSWDMIHEGHALYLEHARSFGDILIVGVDSDEKIRERKGPERPVVPQNERLHMLTHLRSVDVVVLKEPSKEKWDLIKSVRPDVLVATRETYNEKQIEELKAGYCTDVIVLDPMGTTSTSARLRLVQIGLATKLAGVLAQRLPAIIQDIIDGAVSKETRNSPTNPTWQKK